MNTNLNIQMVDLKNQYLKIKSEIDSAIFDVINSSQFIQGKPIRELELEIANYLGCKYAIGCASGTDALQIAMMSIDIKPGDEIITTPFTFVATVETIALLGAKPVYVDIDEKTFNMNIDEIEKKITNKTKAIIPVHLYGQSAEMDKLIILSKKYNLKVIEDSAQAFGSEFKGKKVSSIGDIGCISFFPSKNLGAYGDGGMITTNDENLAEKIRMITVHGAKRKYFHDILGVNSRLDTIQAAILRVKLKYIDEYTDLRRKAANLYDKFLSKNIIIPYRMDKVKHVFHQYTIRINKRDELQNYLKENYIPSMIYYPVPLHLQNAYRYNYKLGDFPFTESASKEVISLPMHTELTENQILYIAEKVNTFVK